jgi:DNA-directed RNA polymerase alpha subunit
VGSEKAEKSNEENDLAGLSTRIIATLAKAGITNKEELKAKVEAGEKIAGIGEKALTEIKAVL